MEYTELNEKERTATAQDLLRQLAAMEQATQDVAASLQADHKVSDTLAALRLRLAAVEHQASLLRLLQAEDRLRQNLWKLGTGFAGVLLGLVARPWLG